MYDRLDKRCEKCHEGYYIKTSINDDKDGKLHCSDCGHEIKRWDKSRKAALGDELLKVVKLAEEKIRKQKEVEAKLARRKAFRLYKKYIENNWPELKKRLETEAKKGQKRLVLREVNHKNDRYLRAAIRSVWNKKLDKECLYVDVYNEAGVTLCWGW